MKWNEVTWYSRLAAFILFFAVIPVGAFYLGMRYESIKYLYPALQEIQIINSNETEITSGWKKYDSDNISFEYPADWGDVYWQTVSYIGDSACEGAIMKTYKPNMYRYTDTITFSKRHPAHVMIGIVRFRESDPYGCDDSGKINLIERRDEFMSQGVGVVETPSGWKEAVSTNEHGLIYTYYPDYYDTLGTEISQIYDMFSTNLFVQASINYFPHGGSPEWEEVSTYECELGEKYGTCGLTKWLREGRTSKGLKADFDALDRLIRTLVVKNQNPVPLEPVNR